MLKVGMGSGSANIGSNDSVVLVSRPRPTQAAKDLTGTSVLNDQFSNKYHWTSIKLARQLS
jgi:hypothetical protein